MNYVLCFCLDKLYLCNSLEGQIQVQNSPTPWSSTLERAERQPRPSVHATISPRSPVLHRRARLWISQPRGQLWPSSASPVAPWTPYSTGAETSEVWAQGGAAWPRLRGHCS